MSRTRDYVPSNAVHFREFMQNLLNYTDSRINVDPPIWKNIPASRWETLAAKFKTFETAQDLVISTPTHQNVNDRNEAQAECTRELRGFVNQFLRFPPVNNGDRIAMGIPNHDTIRTDHKVVTEIVDFVLHLRNIREIMVDFWIQGESHKAKPAGYDGAVIIWGIFDAPPQHTDDFMHHTMASRTPFPLHFDETERGKTVYVAAAWQNERGIIGQWSEIKTAIVP